MKAFCILVLTLSLHINTLYSSNTSLVGPEKPAPAKKTWVKSEDGTWPGGYNVWFKMDQKNNTVKLSTNQKKWKTGQDAVWQDKDGRWFYVFEGKLMSKSDGKNWVEATDNSWQGINGKWYHLNNTTWELEEAMPENTL